MLASKKGEGNVLNTQIDFLTRSFRGWNVEELLNVDELNRRAFAANKNLFNINLWVSITADDVEDLELFLSQLKDSLFTDLVFRLSVFLCIHI